MAPLRPTTVFLVIISMFCMEAVVSDNDVMKWTDCGGAVYADKKLDFTADMSNVKVGQECHLSISHSARDNYIGFEITAITEQDEDCGMDSNRLTMTSSKRPENPERSYELSLLCGRKRSTETSKPIFQRTSIDLVFHKTSASSKLLKFDFSITPHSSMEQGEPLPTGSYKSSDKEWQLYSPLFPVVYSSKSRDAGYKLDIETDKDTVVFFNFQSVVPEENSKMNTISISGVKNHAIDNNRASPLVVRPHPNNDSMSVVHGHEVGTSFELQFKSLKENPFTCTSDSKNEITVTEAFYLPINVKQHPTEQAKCDVKLSHKTSDKAFKITLTSSKLLQDQPKSYQLQISVGDKQFQLDNNGVFGFIQGMKDESMTISVVANKDEGSHSTNPDVEIGFVVELVDMENPPAKFVTEFDPSYIWIPSEKKWEDNGFYVKTIRENSCLQFTALNSDSTPRTGSLSDVVSLYTTPNRTDAFDMAKDCLGRPGPRVINTTNSLITYAVPKSQEKAQSGFWLKLNKVEDGCRQIVTQLSVPSGSSTKNLFDSVHLKTYMNCTFALHRSPNGLKFRGMNISIPRILVAEAPSPSQHHLAAFNSGYTSENWFYSQHDLIIFVTTGGETYPLTVPDHSVFEYGARESPVTVPGCPGPQTIDADSSKPVVINTPSYPGHLESNVTCQWTIRRPDSQRSKYLYVEMKESSMVKCNDFTQVYMSGDKGTQEKQICGKSAFVRVFSGDTDSITVRIVGGTQFVVDGIQMNFTLKEMDFGYLANCNKTFTIGSEGPTTDAVSANLNPGQFLVPFVCKMHFRTENQNDKAVLDLASVMLKPSNNDYKCGENSFQVIDDATGRQMMMPGTCSSNTMKDRLLAGTGNQITVMVSVMENYASNYIYDFYGTRYGDCRSRVLPMQATKFNKTLTSFDCQEMFSLYRSCQDNIIQCDWSITSKSADIEIINAEYGLPGHGPDRFKDGCDSVEIFDGPKMDVSLGNLCGTSKENPTIKFQRKALFIRYKSNKTSHEVDKKFFLRFREDVPLSAFKNGRYWSQHNFRRH